MKFTFLQKKNLQIFSAGPFVSLLENKKAKGEEKPEEELMGKCKSSPCFETAKLILAVSLCYYVHGYKLYTLSIIFLKFISL